VRSLDTNCLLRWLLNDIPDQADMVSRVLAQQGRCDVADVALVEVAFVLEKRLGLSRATVSASLDLLVADPRFVFDKRLWSGVLADYLDHPKLSLVDIYLAGRARADVGGDLLTFDRLLASQSSGVRLVPDVLG